MATHCSNLACEITWTEDPGGLHSMGHKESGMTSNLHTLTHHGCRSELQFFCCCLFCKSYQRLFFLQGIFLTRDGISEFFVSKDSFTTKPPREALCNSLLIPNKFIIAGYLVIYCFNSMFWRPVQGLSQLEAGKQKRVQYS